MQEADGTSTGDSTTSLEISARPGIVYCLFLFPLLFPPVVRIDGQRVRGLRWFGQVRMQLAHGNHLIEARSIHDGTSRVVNLTEEPAFIHFKPASTDIGSGRLSFFVGQDVRREIPDAPYGFELGQAVEHPELGQGLILGFDVSPDDGTVFADVEFEDGVYRVNLHRDVLYEARDS